ncbi:MAG: c-type cytochrome [bacterium]|nr:c-type cytochrome [Gammaproteobacteria bacterium]HIL96686.1 c-type cytochrome [Pseudomonadales bacterium]
MGKMIAVVLLLMCVLPLTGLADGKSSYAICVTCHGANGEGNTALNSPALAGQEAWYLKTQINNFKEGIRGTHKSDIYGMQMRPMAMTLATDAMVSDVADYINQMSPISPESTTGGNADAGKARYMVCAACHGIDGKGLANLNSPDLTLQQDWYLVRQINNFKSGIRGGTSKDVYGMQMRPMAMTLTDDQAVKDVAAYILTLGK